LRYKRIVDRARVDDSRDLIDIKERDLREIGFGLKSVIKNADFHIYNEGSIEDLKKQTRIIVLKILKSFFDN
jgi:dephospho-CoA kinase